MKTPICDFVQRYADEQVMRLHMPGHKGNSFLGVEQWDITEIDGADNLYQPTGIIRESEQNATALFGCDTFYSTEGSSQCIRAMLYLTAMWAGQRHVRIAAAGNVHKAFVDAVALLDLDVEWMFPREQTSYLSCDITADDLERAFNQTTDLPTAVYVTSPDYLGHIADVRALAEVCHRYGVLLLVDNAHGAYLRFLTPSCHPIDLGADMCCDSAHKTLPVLTGGAYLHIAPQHASALTGYAKEALSLFGSTSPSYLILQSLDRANAYLSDGYRERLAAFTEQVQDLKNRLRQVGYVLLGDEVLKLAFAAKAYGYTGEAFAKLLRQCGVEVEFTDPDYVVLMLSPDDTDLQRLEHILCAVPAQSPLLETRLPYKRCERVMSVREAVFSAKETVAVAESIGRICASSLISCPPAVPIVVAGERIHEHAVRCFEYYGITSCAVVV